MTRRQGHKGHRVEKLSVGIAPLEGVVALTSTLNWLGVTLVACAIMLNPLTRLAKLKLFQLNADPFCDGRFIKVNQLMDAQDAALKIAKTASDRAAKKDQT